MKICQKCKYEYKDEYVYCPKCGAQYDNSPKKIKIQKKKNADVHNSLKLMCNIILYVIGGFTILGCLLNIGESPLTSIVGILFGLSLFQVIYRVIEDKSLVDSKYLKIARILLPILLLIIIGFIYSPTS